jgi:hypothetical protein
MGLWSRFIARWHASEDKHAIQEAGMSPEERRFEHEGVDGRAADEFVQSQLGGTDPSGLIDDGRPRHEY